MNWSAIRRERSVVQETRIRIEFFASSGTHNNRKKSMSTSPTTPTSPGSEPIRRALREVDKNLRDVQKLCSRKSSKVQVSVV